MPKQGAMVLDRASQFSLLQKQTSNTIEWIKWFAIVFMVIDHAALILFSDNEFGRTLGRLSFPLCGNTPETGMDCSGYTKYVFSKVGINIPRTAYTQSKVGQTIEMQNLKKGDLLFFLTDKKRNIPITHVGIYLGNDKFIHAASSKKGIIISSLSTGYYNKVFKGAKRVIKDDWSFKQSFYIALDEEAIKSSMEIKLTSFGGINDTF